MTTPLVGTGYITVPIDQVVPNPHNKGDRWVGDEEDQAFMETIRAKGVMEPLLVTPRADGLLEIVGGERRWRASKELALATVPVVIREEVKAGTASEEMLIENHARKNLSAWETLTALIEAVENRSAEAKVLGYARPSMEAIASAIGIPKRMAQRYYTVDGKLDEPTRVAIAASVVLRRSLSVSDLERVGATHVRERADALAKLEEVYRNAESPNKARRSGAAAAATKRASYGVKLGGVVAGKCTISPDPTADLGRMLQPVVELDLKVHPLLNLDDPQMRAQLIDHVRKVSSKLIKQIEVGPSDQKLKSGTDRGNPPADGDDDGAPGQAAGEGDTNGLVQRE